MGKKKLSSSIEIVELMLVKAGNDFTRTFMAEIYCETTKTGKPIVRGNVVVKEGIIWSSAESQEELRKFLDDICLLKLDYGVHSAEVKTVTIYNIEFCLN